MPLNQNKQIYKQTNKLVLIVKIKEFLRRSFNLLLVTEALQVQ